MDLFNTCYETTNEVRALAYYSHLIPGFITLLLGSFVLIFAKNKTKALLFFSFTSLLVLWLLGNLVTWTSNDYFLVAAFWSTLDYINILFYLAIFCFIVVDFTKNKRLPYWILLPVIVIGIVPFLLTVAGMSVHEFDLPNCEMYGNAIIAEYKLVTEWLIIFGILVAAIIAVIRNWGSRNEVRRIIIAAISVAVFLGIFSSTEYISTATDIYEINLYALFTLPIFLAILTYSILEHGTFKFNVDSIWVLRVLFIVFLLVSSSKFLLDENFVEYLITGLSTLATTFFGLLVLRSAARENAQRKELEQITGKLEKANKRLKILDQMKSEFVSIASHQLRSPLTSIRGYASMLLEGSFGKLSDKSQEAVEKIADSSRFMALSVEDYLNVSRIQSGKMKYEKSDFNLKDMTFSLVDDMRREAMRHGLVLKAKSDLQSKGIVNADIGKTRQVIQNLVDNALKYTPKGTITVTVRDSKKSKKIYIDVADSGIGMDPATIETLFDKFERAHNANDVNVTGTGLGLYIARKMTEDMGGTLTATSVGEGKGSIFTIELPLQM